MAREDEYGPLLKQAVIDAGTEGISVGELYPKVGCSRQRAYSWVEREKANLRAVDKSSKGGVRYTWVDSSRTPRGVPTASMRGVEGVEVGSQLTITRMRWVEGKLAMTVRAGDGTELDIATLDT